MKILETKRLSLQKFTMLNAEPAYQIFGNSEVMKFSMGLKSRSQVKEWLKDTIEDYTKNSHLGCWAVIEKRSGNIIGYCSLIITSDISDKEEIEIGYRLIHKYWGYGYATEITKAVLVYAFSKLNIPRVVASIDPENTVSLKVAQKIGMKYQREIMLEGYDHPDHLYYRESVSKTRINSY